MTARKLELKLIDAIKAGKPVREGNTAYDGKTVTLHGHPILCIDAQRRVTVRLDTLQQWPTATTKSRVNNLLSGLGLRVSFATRNRVLLVRIAPGLMAVPVASLGLVKLHAGVIS